MQFKPTAEYFHLRKKKQGKGGDQFTCVAFEGERTSFVALAEATT